MALPLEPSWSLPFSTNPAYVAGGDLDGDGFSDVVIASGNQVSVYRGHANGPLPTPTWEWTAPLTSSHVGEGLAVGDVDRDGYGDLVIGSPLHIEYVSTGRGAVFVFRGGPTGLGSTPNVTYLGLQEFGELGRSVAIADVDNDSRPDLVAGASGWTVTSGTTDLVAGAVFVYAGTGTGLPADMPVRVMTGTAYGALGTHLAIGTFDAGDGDIVVTNPLRDEALAVRGGSLTAFRSRVWTGGSGFATSLAAGDFDADGLDDVAIGTWEGPLDCTIDSPVGVDVYPGDAAAPSATPVFSERSDWASTGFGRDVAVGNFDEDAFADLIVAAPCMGDGAALEFRGSAGGPATRPTWQGTVDVAAKAEFASEVASAGDVNGDGYSDIVVGAPDYSNGESQEGLALVYYGSASGPPVTPSWTYETDQPGYRLGWSVAGAGDVNGDGFNDLLLGMDNLAGEARLFYGNGAGGLDRWRAPCPANRYRAHWRRRGGARSRSASRRFPATSAPCRQTDSGRGRGWCRARRTTRSACARVSRRRS